nr:thiamine phosphate synthase [Saccharicrinis fermentans]
MGTEQLQKVLRFANVPVVAIGGIFLENIEQVTKAGAKNIAMVRHFMQSTKFDEQIENVNKLLK